jgi:hypothetical protein
MRVAAANQEFIPHYPVRLVELLNQRARLWRSARAPR